jgi:hypothetical protein
LTEIFETKSDADLKNAFKSTFKIANVGLIVWCFLVGITLVSLTFWSVTGIRWISLVGAGSLCLALAGIWLAFASQTLNQIVRIIAKLNGKAKDFFREEEKECSLSKTAAECYGFIKHIFNRGRNSYDDYGINYTYNRHVGNNARSYRSSSRQAAHSSGDDGSDDSDSGDSEPPEPSHHATRLKLPQIFYSKSNSFSSPWRLLHVFGCWCTPYRKRPFWRWSA